MRKLKPVIYDATNRTECLNGTRTDLIQTITEWALDPASIQNILWLYGLAGSGKSALSTTIANHLRGEARLGAFIFCDRDDVDRSDPSKVIKTLAYQLSSFDAGVRAAMSTVLRKLPDIHSSPIRSQFLHLLVNTLTSHGVIDSSSPIIVVLDAMDECGNPDSRETLLEVLAEMWGQLPSSVRLFITSRNENDIRAAFEDQEHVHVLELMTDTLSNSGDISAYLRSRLSRVRQKSKGLRNQSWPTEDDIRMLTVRASGLFVWASTASKFINGFNPRARMDTLLKGRGDSDPQRALDQLYQTALLSVGNWDEDDFLSSFRHVVGIILVAKRPLSPSAIDALSMPDGRVSCEDTISYLGCVLQQSPTVRFLHPSFMDFLVDRSRCGRDIWWFQEEEHNLKLAGSCLVRLNRALKRNFCDIKLSPDLVDVEIPEDIAYACLFWVDHICSIVNEDSLKSILEHLRTLLYQHLLHWIEVMSLLKRPRDTITHLKTLHSWILVS